MRHTTKIRESFTTWDTFNFLFDATSYRAKLDSNQVTVVIEQTDDEGKTTRQVKSFRADTPANANELANIYINQAKKNSKDEK